MASELHFGVSMSPADDLVATAPAGDTDPLFRVVDAKGGAEVASVGLTSDRGWASLLAFDPGGVLVAVGLEDYGVEIWDWRTGVRRATLLEPGGVITDMRWSSDGRFFMVTGHEDQTVAVYDTSDWRLVELAVPHLQVAGTDADEGVTAASIRSDGRLLLVPAGPAGIEGFDPE